MKIRLLTLSLLLAMGAAVAADAGPVASEGEAIAHLMALNEHEIKVADMAATKDLSPPVAEFAAMLKRVHSENHAASARLASAPAAGGMDSSGVVAQKASSASDRQMLSAKSGLDFEVAYLEAMVKDHEDALAMLDSSLIPAATTPSLQSHLRQTREHIAMHLEQAEALQNE